MRTELRKERDILLLFSIMSFYFLTVDVVADAALVPLLSEDGFFMVRTLYLLGMSLGFLSFRRFHALYLPSGQMHRAALPALAVLSLLTLAGIGAVPGLPAIIPVICTVACLYLAGLLGALTYHAAALRLSSSGRLGMLLALGMGAATLMQALFSMLPIPLPAQAAVLCAALLTGLRCFQHCPERTPLHDIPEGQEARGRIPGEARALPSLACYLAAVAVVALLGGLNDAELTWLNATGALNLYALPRLFFFPGLALSGFLYDRYGMRGLSMLVLFVMICSTGGASFLESPETILLNASIYSLLAGIAIIYFTVPLFASFPQAPKGLMAVWPSLGRAVRLPALAAGCLLYEWCLKGRSSRTRLLVYVICSATAALLIFLSIMPKDRAPEEAKGTGASGKAEDVPAPGETEHVPASEAAAFRPSPAPAPASEADREVRIGAFSREYGLTARETDVLRAILDSSLSTPLLAKELSMGERTLYRHLSSIYKKNRDEVPAECCHVVPQVFLIKADVSRYPRSASGTIIDA